MSETKARRGPKAVENARTGSTWQKERRRREMRYERRARIGREERGSGANERVGIGGACSVGKAAWIAWTGR